MKDLLIRTASIDDAKDLLNIYSYYVENTAITFEYDVPSIKEFQNRIKNTLMKYPYIVAILDNKIVGYAYAGTFKNRAAYDHSVEVTIYLDKDFKKIGLGRILYATLEELLKEMNIINVYACITYPDDKKDPYATLNSVEFHHHLGYEIIGKFNQCGYKFNRWYSMVWMEKMLYSHKEVKDVIYFNNKDIKKCVLL